MERELEARHVKDILSSINMQTTTLQFLTAGSTSSAWRADTRSDTVVIRLGRHAHGKTTSFAADATVRRLLACHDTRVATPIATGNWEVAMGESMEWCVDRFVHGAHPPRGSIPERACRELGELLAHVHMLPVERFGRLENQTGVLMDRAADPISGLLMRLQDPWPLGPTQTLKHHPIASAAPDLVELLLPLENELRTVVVQPRNCLNHTDLHEGQLILSDNHLMSLIDFGDATIGPPAWDIASFAFFHGWELASALLAGYTSDETQRQRLVEDARLFAVLMALHHASRSVTLGRPHRMQFALDSLRRTLSQEWDYVTGWRVSARS